MRLWYFPEHSHKKDVACSQCALFRRERRILLVLRKTRGTAVSRVQCVPGEAGLSFDFANGRGRARGLHGGVKRCDHGPWWGDEGFGDFAWLPQTGRRGLCLSSSRLVFAVQTYDPDDG